VHGGQFSTDMLYLDDKARGYFNQKIASQNKIAYYEPIKMTDVFYGITDIELAKKMIPESVYVKKLKNGDELFIPFVIAVYLASSEFYQGKFAVYTNTLALNGYLNLYKLMDDDAMRAKIEKKFGYTIADFRKSYSTPLNKGVLSCDRLFFAEIIGTEKGFYLKVWLKCRKLFSIKIFPNLFQSVK
jgi:hypothetical protein